MKLLLLRLSSLGDIAHSLGAVQALARARPDLEIHYLVQREFADLLVGIDAITSVISHERRPALRGYIGTARRLRRLAPDIAVDLQGNWKSAGLARLSGAARRIGTVASERREGGSAWLLNEFVAKSELAHPYLQAESLLRVLSPDLRADLPRVQAADKEVEDETASLSSLGIDPMQPFRVLVCSDPADPRAWPISAMQREHAASPLPAIWLRGPAEVRVQLPAGAKVLEHAPGQLRRLVALARVVAMAGGEVLGPDRGATHVLSAGGAETTVFFGPQDPQLTAPPAATALQAEKAPDCMPCRRRRCHHPDGPICMNFTAQEGVVVGGGQ